MGRRFPPQLRSSIAAALHGSCRRATHASPTPSISPSITSFRFQSPLPSFTPSSPPFSLFPISSRYFSSDSSQDAIIIGSAEAFENSLKNVKENASPAIFYFSAAWCGPCKSLSPVVNQLSKMYPPCVTYKIDIDMEGIQSKLEELEISAVPTLKFFNGGKQVAVVVGADVKKINEVMNQFFK